MQFYKPTHTVIAIGTRSFPFKAKH